MGSVFNIPLIKTNREGAIEFLVQNKFNLYNTVISKNSQNYLDIDYSGNIAVAFGSENQGLSKNWRLNKAKDLYRNGWKKMILLICLFR